MADKPKKNRDVNKARREAKRDKRKEKKQKAHLDKDGFTMPQVPQNRGQLFDPAKLQQGIADNQQEILQTPRAKQKNKDAQDPFKNGFFKSKEELYRKNEASQNADRVIQQNQLQNARGNVEQLKKEQAAGTDERTNAQKLFAPAVPDIQTDKQGNKLASRNGKPVGFSGNPKGAASPSRMSPQGLMDDPNQSPYGMTNAESAANQSIIQNVAANFEPTDIVGREMYRRQQTGEGNKFSLPQVPSQPSPQLSQAPSSSALPVAPATQTMMNAGMSPTQQQIMPQAGPSQISPQQQIAQQEYDMMRNFINQTPKAPAKQPFNIQNVLPMIANGR